MSVAWYGASAADRRIGASIRPAGGVLGAAQPISPGTAENALDPQVGIDAQGRALAVWYRWTGSAYEVEWAFRDPSSAFASAHAISAPSDSALDPDVAVSPAGAAAVVWSRFDGASFRVEASVADATATPPDPGPPPPPPPPLPPPPPPADLKAPPALATLVDRVAPAVSGFAVTPRFAVAATPTPLASLLPRRGGRIRFSISEPASVSIRIAPAAHPGLLRGTLVRRYAGAGANGLAFSGRLGSRALRPGRYAAMIEATDAAGNRSPLRGDAFKVVRIMRGGAR
jgi:hypothetical protein